MIFRKGAVKPGTNHNITSSATSQAVSGITSYVVRIATTEDIYVDIGATATASTASMIVPKGAIELLAIDDGEEIAVLQVTTSGTVSITELV